MITLLQFPGDSTSEKVFENRAISDSFDKNLVVTFFEFQCTFYYIWRNKHISLKVKVRLYESLVMSTMLYSAELWPLTIPQKKKLDAAYLKFQRRLLGITWKDKVRNEDIRNQTKLQRMDLIIKERRLRWLGHVLRMEDDRIPKQAIRWQMDSCSRRRPGRPRLNWIDTVTRDLKSIGMAWEEAEQAAVDKED